MFEWIATHLGPVAAVVAAAACFALGTVLWTSTFTKLANRLQQGLRRPLLISLAILPCALSGASGLGMVLGVAAGVTPHMYGEPVGPATFFREAWIFLIATTWLGAVSYAFLRHRPWGRPLATLWWVVMAVGFISQARAWHLSRFETLLALAELAVFLAVAIWYFYRKSSVVEYYASLRTAA